MSFGAGIAVAAVWAVVVAGVASGSDQLFWFFIGAMIATNAILGD